MRHQRTKLATRPVVLARYERENRKSVERGDAGGGTDHCFRYMHFHDLRDPSIGQTLSPGYIIAMLADWTPLSTEIKLSSGAEWPCPPPLRPLAQGGVCTRLSWAPTPPRTLVTGWMDLMQPFRLGVSGASCRVRLSSVPLPSSSASSDFRLMLRGLVGGENIAPAGRPAR
eukprot:2305845-Pleurochrysis_carterae.AAC.2